MNLKSMIDQLDIDMKQITHTGKRKTYEAIKMHLVLEGIRRDEEVEHDDEFWDKAALSALNAIVQWTDPPVRLEGELITTATARRAADYADALMIMRRARRTK